MLGAVTIAVWPAFAARRASPRPLILSVYGAAAVTAVFAALLGWLLAETRRASACGQQPQFPGALHGRGPVTDLELGVDAADVRADRARRDG